MQIPQDLLIGSHQEETDIAGLVIAKLRHGQCRFDAHPIHIVLDYTVRVTGDIQDLRAALVDDPGH